MKRGLFLVAVLTAFSCSTQGYYCHSKLNLVTYNVGVFGKYETDSSPLVASALTCLKADLVSLNELDSCNRRHNTYQIETLSRKLGGWDFHFASAFPYADGAYGNGVVSRAPVQKRWTLSLPKGEGAEPRSVAVVETKQCIFASVHLDHRSAEAQLEQVRILCRWFEEHFAASRKPVFLCGDMNALPESATIAALKEHWTLLSPTDFTFPSRNPVKCIDYIFSLTSARKVEVLRSGVARTVPIGFGGEQGGTLDLSRASDHLPVFIEIKW